MPLCKLEPIFKLWIKEVQAEMQSTKVGFTKSQNELLAILHVSELLNLLYSKVSKDKLPVMKRKHLLFSRTELSDYKLADNGQKHEGSCKNAVFGKQLKTLFQYLQNHIATASMIAKATGIPQKNICRYKRDLEKAGLLWEVEKKKCKETGFRAWYITANSDFLPKSEQLSLF